MSNIAGIIKSDIADGPGVRVGVFLSGCPHHCPGCFNQELWDYNYGEPFIIEETPPKIKELLSRPCISGISILGGEPMCDENVQATWMLIHAAHYYGKDAWLYTGYTLEELYNRMLRPYVSETTSEFIADSCIFLILKTVDVLVDGRFEQSLADKRLQFRGSSNQRIIDMPATIKSGHIVLWNK